MMFQFPNQNRKSAQRVLLAQRPLHQAYGALSFLFVVALSAVVVVGVIQAAPAVTQYGVGWFDNSGKSGTAYQQIGNDSPVQGPTGPDQIGFERQLFALINKARIDKGLAPLRLNETLTRAARTHSKDMVAAQKLDVTDSLGRTPVQRADDSGYPQAAVVIETVAAGFGKADQVLSALTGNANTLDTLLNAEVNEIGVGYAYGKDDRNFRHYWTVDLGRRSGLAYTIVVNTGAESTTSQQVTLHIGGKGWARQMQLANSPDFSGVNWENYSETKTWNLTEGTGPKKIYVKLRGAGDQETLAIGEIALVPAAKGAKPGPHANYSYQAPRPANVRVLAGDVTTSGGTTSGGT
ncbi:MAG: CAP domain-containing protein, partial [Chloroflexi bacterium]|nr:CAP domain-containing protein [Chloroflexota bacterium]